MPFKLPGALLWTMLFSALAVRTTARTPMSSTSTEMSHLPLGHRRRVQEEQPNATATASPPIPSSSIGYPRRYHLLPPETIKEMLYDWVSYYPDLVRLTNAQDQYGLPTAGDTDDCPHDDDVKGCRNYILTIQDFTKHPEGSDGSNRLPEVFLSGELHGNERVGPTAVMEAAQLLLIAADCEAKPRHMGSSQHSFNDKNTDWTSQLKAAKDCRAKLKSDHGVDDVHRKWLARIVSTRRIVIVPTANALGYYRNRREEGTVDPNRDFPYDVEDATACMQTIAGRTLNEIFREHMFQLSLTFHGGMEVVAYEWGAPTWLGHLSPDDTAQAVIGGAYSQYGGGFATSKPYQHGTMNDLVYFVRGGFEDWAYAGSWDPKRVIPCEPSTFKEYDVAKTIYNNSTLRVFNMLVETSDQKEPSDQYLGTSLNVFVATTAGNGHVSRNIRLSLLACDVVQPYVQMIGVNDLTLSTDIIPMAVEEDRSCQSTQAVMVPGNQQDVELRWTVGGAFDIDNTQVWYAKWDDVPPDVLNCNDMPSKANIAKYFKQADLTSSASGTGFFSKAGPGPKSTLEVLGPLFSAKLDVSKDFKTHDKIVIIAGARVDQSWKTQPKNMAPNLPPQSHIVNARTNPDWYHESSNKIVQGRVDWYSLPLTIVVGDYKDSVGSQAGRPVGTVELSNRFGESTGSFHAGITPSTSSGTGGQEGGSGFVVILVATISVGCLFLVLRRYSTYRRRPLPTYSADSFDDDDADAEFGVVGNYSDKKELELNSNFK